MDVKEESPRADSISEETPFRQVSAANFFLKRAFDVAASLGAFLALGLPMLVVAILVKATSKGPVLYWSNRVGKDNELFPLPKFRSMRTDTGEMPQHLVPENAITPVGGFIRRWSLDELPQLWCVLKGDMSVVGPRPVLPKERVFLNLRDVRGVSQLKPGLTGWAQINGRGDVNLADKLELDVYYLQNFSFWLDLKIVFLTVPKVFLGHGVSRDDYEPEDDEEDF